MKESFGQFPRIYRLENIPEALIGRETEVFYKKNTIIVSPGDVLEGFYYIKKGRVIAFEYFPKGNEEILSILEERSIFLESNVLLKVPAFCYFKTLEDTFVNFVKREDLLELLAKDLNVTLYVIESIAMKLYSHVNHADEILYYDSEWRICNLLLTFADNFGGKEDKKIRLNIKTSQQFISNLLGINRITTTKVISKLKQMKLIEQTDGYYYIKDIQRLREHQKNIII
ncbi:cyclic nucleotide-binding protein [Dehalobacter sp. MCB1]|uniref:Crp/Fnr family transcriptional regulator n=1 Tax=unclassified Dehalobacter TaxID=2635733 RepID=UPI000E6C379C|nr:MULTISPECIES: Crp/Fnr family transcriptional regulator [unclassified Dehalobacter]RJE47280.1 cyclic nucleotide-binding protein [Dehalobacter sp. MCB1]TCX55319.1 Crp/Fnr family transcriptional regulator [Dehalobacter sp. 12DCB1]